MQICSVAAFTVAKSLPETNIETGDFVRPNRVERLLYLRKVVFVEAQQEYL